MVTADEKRQYIIFFQLVPFMIVAIYFSKVNFWNSVFLASPGTQAGNVNKAWFSVFQVVAAYTGSGLRWVNRNIPHLALQDERVGLC
jgi:hypothetical protein